MPNQLKMPKIQSILGLREKGWSFVRIASELGIHRETVARYVRLHSKPSEAPPGSGGSKLSEAQPRSEAVATGRSDCEPLRKMIQEKVDQGLSAKRIHQDLADLVRISKNRKLVFGALDLERNISWKQTLNKFG